MVRKSELVLPFSKIKFRIAEILVEGGWLKAVEKIERGKETHADQLKIVLKYLGPKEPAIRSLTRISKPGRRVYAIKDNLPVVLNHLGVAIISTSRGLMTNKKAKKLGLGGEIICEIY